MPYGLKRLSTGQIMAFNREYLPLGWNDLGKKESMWLEDPYKDYPVYTHYKRVTDAFLLKIAHGGEGSVVRDKNTDKITGVFLYEDRTNPVNNANGWPAYLEKIRLLAELQVDSKAKLNR